MKEKTILVHKVNAQTYQEFAGLCKAEGTFIGHKLSDLMLGFTKANKSERNKFLLAYKDRTEE